jgi:hypothetical protein
MADVSRLERRSLTRMHNMHTVTCKWTLSTILPRRRGICVSTVWPLRIPKACLWTLSQCIALIQTLRARSDSWLLAEEAPASYSLLSTRCAAIRSG